MTADHHNASKSYDEVNAGLVLVLVIVSAIVAGGVIVPLSMALDAHVRHIINEADVVNQPHTELVTHELNETSRITRYRWVDEKAGIAAIPIDRAIELYARQHASDDE